jgi:phosphatidylglycerophosphatase A
MQNPNKLLSVPESIENHQTDKTVIRKKTLLDYFSLGITTIGVGYLPLAPGTWGSAVGVLFYWLISRIELNSIAYFSARGWQEQQILAWYYAVNSLLLLLFCLLGIWAANRATKLFANKDPQQAVVDEVIGQLITFLFIPFGVHWFYILAGFLLFRLFDIWKPYPIDSLQDLPTGLGVCADDILAGIYAGICLAILYAMGISI